MSSRSETSSGSNSVTGSASNSEERYRALFTQTRYPMALVRESDSVICEANEAHATLFGYTPDEMVGHTALGLGIWVDPSQREGLQRQLNANGFVYEYPMVGRTKHGEMLHALLSVQPVTFGDQRYNAVFVRDVTEHVRTAEALRKSESLLRTLLDAIPDPVWLKDAQGRFLAVNAAWSEFVGVEPGGAIGKTSAEVFPPNVARELERRDSELMAQGNVMRIEETIPGRDGADRSFETTKSVAVGDEGQIVGTVGIARDVTAKKQAELELAARTEGYEARLRSLSIEASLAEERERRNLAGHLHDDVCQILAVAAMKLSLARQTPAGAKRNKLVADTENLVTRSNRAARSLMLQLSHPALYDLGIVAAAEWLTEDIQRLYDVRINFADDGRPKPLDLPRRVVLFQCLRELLVNAAKHSGRDEVDVDLVRDGEIVRVTVRDTGRGFDPETVETRAARGFGFFSVRTRLANLGGKSEFQSAPGEGTTVRLEIPLAERPTEAADGSSIAG